MPKVSKLGGACDTQNSKTQSNAPFNHSRVQDVRWMPLDALFHSVFGWLFLLQVRHREPERSAKHGRFSFVVFSLTQKRTSFGTGGVLSLALVP